MAASQMLEGESVRIRHLRGAVIAKPRRINVAVALCLGACQALLCVTVSSCANSHHSIHAGDDKAIPQKAAEGPCNELEDRWDFDALAETASRFEKLLADAARSGDKECELQVMTQLARVKGLLKDFGSADEVLTTVATRLEPPMIAARMRLMLERGRVLLDTHHEKEAASSFEKAWTLGTAGGDEYLTVDAAHMLAIVHAARPQLSKGWNEKALRMVEASKSQRTKKWSGSLYNNMGWTCFDEGDFASALSYFMKALDWRESHQRPRNIRAVLIARFAVAHTLRMSGRHKDALELQFLLEKQYKSAGLPENGYVYEEIGECLLALGDPLATSYFLKAYTLLSNDPQMQSETQRLNRLRELSQR